MGGVLMDVDGTLLEGPSSERRFVRYLIQARYLGAQQVASALAFYALWWSKYGTQVGKKNKAYLAGLDVGPIEEMAAKFVHQDLSKRVRPSMLERIRKHQWAGQPVALLTGTPDFIARPLAAQLGVAALSATQCAQQDEVFIGCPPLVHPFGDGKLQSALALCAELKVPLEECVAYADSYYDLPLLHRVGIPVAVHPDRRLRQMALREGWGIVEY
jgi:HAD superfamily hydrolase (TIGR01490 family)